MSSLVLPLHLGALHPYEQVLTYLLAFGPFVVLGIVVYVVRKRDAEDTADTAGTAPEDTDGTDGP